MKSTSNIVKFLLAIVDKRQNPRPPSAHAPSEGDSEDQNNNNIFVESIPADEMATDMLSNLSLEQQQANSQDSRRNLIEKLLRLQSHRRRYRTHLADQEKPQISISAADIAFHEEKGDLYMTARCQHVVYKVSGGSVSVFAGQLHTPGLENGRGNSALFNRPNGIKISSDGNILIADEGNCAVRLITPNGDVSTVSTLPIQPFSVDSDANGTIYVAGETKILKLSRGNFSTIFSDNESLLRGITVHKNGNIYFSDIRKSQIFCINRDSGDASVFAGCGVRGFADGSIKSAMFSLPQRLAFNVDYSTLVIMDNGNHRIRRIKCGESPGVF